MPCSAGFSQRKQKTCPQPWASQARFPPVSQGHCGFVFTGKPAVPGFSPPTFDEGKSCRQKKQKNFTKALAVFFRSEYITATDAADMIRDTRRAISSVGRAPRLHRGCREFESLIAHHSQAYQFLSLKPNVNRMRFLFSVNSSQRESPPAPLINGCRGCVSGGWNRLAIFPMPNRYSCFRFRQLLPLPVSPRNIPKNKQIQTF